MALSIQSVVRDHRHRVYSLACYTLGSPDDAEDVTQEVLLRYWRNAGSVDPERVEGWLVRVTVNACRDLQRRQTRRREAPDTALDAEPCPGPAPGDGLESADELAEVRRLLAELREPFRSVVVLREVEGLSYAAIAEALDMPLSSVRVNLHRGRRMLAEQITRKRNPTERETEAPQPCSNEA